MDPELKSSTRARARARGERLCGRPAQAKAFLQKVGGKTLEWSYSARMSSTVPRRQRPCGWLMAVRHGALGGGVCGAGSRDDLQWWPMERGHTIGTLAPGR